MVEMAITGGHFYIQIQLYIYVCVHAYVYVYVYVYRVYICVCMCIYIYNHIIMCPIFRHIQIHFKKNSEEPRGRCGPKDSSPTDLLAPSFSSSGPLC